MCVCVSVCGDSSNSHTQLKRVKQKPVDSSVSACLVLVKRHMYRECVCDGTTSCLIARLFLKGRGGEEAYRSHNEERPRE